jgi:hypothetical protein
MTNPQVFLNLRWDSLRKEKESYVMALQSHIDQLKHMIDDDMFPPSYYGEIQKLISGYKNQISALEGVKL